MERKIYAVVGEPTYTICESYLQPTNTIEMKTINTDVATNVAMPDGTWGTVNEYSRNRQSAILKTWPINLQLEAIMEFHEIPSRPEKLNAFREFMDIVKQEFPKSK